ncbi:MAG: biotin--[acetyl-CoA-carboxylase] ligase [Tannerellaceae bacterium]|jgi:BirA family biotin operon repressor/biotin-[acetyl-CoA-carboxylase] ligase|nr:biotin--[acetyl-CoA-carboxylase] ligase [Tannerellaceae bacterium]
MHTDSPPRIIRLDETPSTNLYLREYLQKEPLPEGSVVVARSQTAGRGQAGNTWEAAPGENLTFSLVIYPSTTPASRQFIISQTVALALKETLDDYTDGISIKWPNDMYRHDRKICGVLIENSLAGREIQSSIIGIGLNLNQTRFTGNAPNPVSLRQITGKTYDKDEVLKHFLTVFYSYYLLLLEEKEDELRAAYRAALYRGDGTFYTFSDAAGRFDARIEDVEPSGHLVLRLRDDQKRRYAFKEISYH